MKKNPWIAAVLNFFFMGLGTLYIGRRKLLGAQEPVRRSQPHPPEVGHGTHAAVRWHHAPAAHADERPPKCAITTPASP